MKGLTANYSRGQIKIQQMAFVLVAIMIFFAIVALFYISIRSAGLKGDVNALREDEARESVKKISGSPEFAWSTTDCASCIDLDKVMALKERESYRDFWDFPLLQIEKIYPESSGECTLQNYPECRTITLIKEQDYIAHSAFVALCRYEGSISKCELGKVYIGFRSTG